MFDQNMNMPKFVFDNNVVGNNNVVDNDMNVDINMMGYQNMPQQQAGCCSNPINEAVQEYIHRTIVHEVPHE